MIKVIAGNNGTGKTRRLIDTAVEAIKSESGIVVFIDKDKSHMMELPHEIRFVDASEYSGNGTADALLGFVSGMLAGNYDITMVCVDGFKKLTKATPIAETEAFFTALDALSAKFNCTFVLNVGEEQSALPPFVARYAI